MTPERLKESLLRLQHFQVSPEEKGERTLEILTHIEAQDKRIEQLEKDKARLDWLEETYKWDDEAIIEFGVGNKDIRQAIDNARLTQ